LKLFLHNFVSLGQILMIFLGRHKLLNWIDGCSSSTTKIKNWPFEIGEFIKEGSQNSKPNKNYFFLIVIIW
jgi:hypothetical protein